MNYDPAASYRPPSKITRAKRGDSILYCFISHLCSKQKKYYRLHIDKCCALAVKASVR